MFKPRLDVFLAHPIHTCALVANFIVLLLVRPPIMLSMLLVTLLVYLSMFFGAKLAPDEAQTSLSSSNDDKPGVR
ncbi:hypothetical protein ACWJKU_02625 [Methylocaldum sp. MU1018]